MLTNRQILLYLRSAKRLNIWSRKFFYEAEEMAVIKSQINVNNQEYQVILLSCITVLCNNYLANLNGVLIINFNII